MPSGPELRQVWEWWTQNWQFVPGFLAFVLSLSLAVRELWRARRRLEATISGPPPADGAVAAWSELVRSPWL